MNEISENVDWCYDILGNVSRTFEIPIKMMDEPHRKYICVSYLLCRIPDTIEDSPELDPDTKIEMLECYKNCINDTSARKVHDFEKMVDKNSVENPLEPDHWELVKNTSTVIDVFNDFPENIRSSIKKWVDELVRGMEKFVGKYDGSVRIEDMDELDEYCYYVAGTVGHMVAEINMDQPSEKIHELAENYGLLLQTVNVAKDVHSDYHEEDNIYIPASLLRNRDVDQEHILERQNLEKSTEAVEEVIAYSRSLVEDAREYLKECSTRVNIQYMRSWAIPYLLAIATLRELEQKAEESLNKGGIKMSRDELGSIIEEVESLESSDLEELESAIEDGKLKS